MIVLTWVATRNLPGLLEVGVLRRFHVDAATRYATTSITRYLIVFTGVILGLSMLGLRWANLQWLAAGFLRGARIRPAGNFREFHFRIDRLVRTSLPHRRHRHHRQRRRHCRAHPYARNDDHGLGQQRSRRPEQEFHHRSARQLDAIGFNDASRHQNRHRVSQRSARGAENIARHRQLAFASFARSRTLMPDDRLRRQHAEFRIARLRRRNRPARFASKTSCNFASWKCAESTTSSWRFRNAISGFATRKIYDRARTRKTKHRRVPKRNRNQPPSVAAISDSKRA